MKIKSHIFILLVFSLLQSVGSYSQKNSSPSIDELARKFNDPDHSAKPWVFWNWMNGNISREGIKADLQALHDVGIGGVMMFNIGKMVPEGEIQLAPSLLPNNPGY